VDFKFFTLLTLFTLQVFYRIL